MSAGSSLHPPYHLRPNKAIDRLLLIELLRQMPYDMRKKYRYLGLGGPFLEDFKAVHHYYPEIALTSIESNSDTYKRQMFNKFTGSITLVKSDIGEYFEQGNFVEPLIVWFDGTDFGEKTISSVIAILTKLPVNSIFKITARVSFEGAPNYRDFARQVSEMLDAYINNEAKIPAEEKSRICKETRAGVLAMAEANDDAMATLQQIKSYLPTGYEKYLLDQESRATLYFLILKNIFRSAYPSAGDTLFHILTANYYSDGTTMVSVTGMVAERAALPGPRELFKNIDVQGEDIEAPTKIAIPILSVKERLKLDPLLPLSDDVGGRLRAELGYLIDASKIRTEKQLEFYNKYHSYYPFFTRIQI